MPSHGRWFYGGLGVEERVGSAEAVDSRREAPYNPPPAAERPPGRVGIEFGTIRSVAVPHCHSLIP